jgi:ATP-dependent Lon protease
MVDEVDKSASGGNHGTLQSALMPFLERETCRAYPDVGLEIECDLSHVCYAFTCNDDTLLQAPLRDRLRVIRVPSPSVEHLPGLAASILKDIAVERAMPASFLPPLAPDELGVIAKAWSGSDGSVRKLQKIISATMTARDEHASRH